MANDRETLIAAYRWSRFLREVALAMMYLTSSENITPPMYDAMVAIASGDEKQNVNNLAAAMSVDYVRAVQLLNRLEDLGLVTRTQDTEDLRVWHPALTDKGSALMLRIARGILPIVTRRKRL